MVRLALPAWGRVGSRISPGTCLSEPHFLLQQKGPGVLHREIRGEIKHLSSSRLVESHGLSWGDACVGSRCEQRCPKDGILRISDPVSAYCNLVQVNVGSSCECQLSSSKHGLRCPLGWGGHWLSYLRWCRHLVPSLGLNLQESCLVGKANGVLPLP